MARPTGGPQVQGHAGPPVYQGYHGTGGVGRANDNNNNAGNNNYSGNNNTDDNGGSGGEEKYACTGPPNISFDEFISIHGRPQQPLMPLQQQPDPNRYPDARYYPQMGGPISLPRNLDQIDYSEYVRK